jgi:hypothetical protein
LRLSGTSAPAARAGSPAVALGDEQLHDGPGGGSRQLDVDLVGRDLDDRGVALDGVADLGVPFEDRALGHRLAGCGRDDIDDLLSGGSVGGCEVRGRRVLRRLQVRGRRVLRRLRRRRGRAVLAVDGDPCDHLPDRHGVALLDQDLCDRAARRGGQLDVHLVGRDLDDRGVELDGIADLDMPFEDRSLCY